MPDPDVTPKKRSRPLNRWGTGTLSVLQVTLLAVVLIALNYLSFDNFWRVDLSRGADYTLSSATTRYLASDAIQSRETPVKWIMAFRRSSPFYERVRALSEEYARLSKGKIKFEFVDPMRSPNRMQEVTAGYDISLVRDLIIIDARTDDSAATTEDANKVRSFNPNIKIATAEEFSVFATADGVRKTVGFQGEDVLTQRLVESLEGKPRVMALLADKSRMPDTGGDSPRKSLEQLLRFQNIHLEEIRMAGLEKIPENVSGIVLAAPAYDLTDDEITVLKNYWSRPRAAILVLIDGGRIPPNLRAFLRANGVTARNDRLVSRVKNKLVTSASGYFTAGVNFTRDLAGQTTEFGGATSSLDVREGDEDLLNRKITPLGLIKALPEFWGETAFGEGGESFDEKQDNPPPLHIAASVIRGAASDDRFAADTSRMVIISNTDFLENRHHRAENLDFLSSSANWLIGREALAGIGPRSLGTYKLPVLDAQVSFINRVNLFFLRAPCAS
ncbi:MAG: DUF7088 domain-containing protein, partial [Verrucomicrobiales bacterium]